MRSCMPTHIFEARFGVFWDIKNRSQIADRKRVRAEDFKEGLLIHRPKSDEFRDDTQKYQQNEEVMN